MEYVSRKQDETELKKFKFFNKMDEGKDRRRERHVIRRYPLASMSVTQFGESQESTTDVSSVTSTRGVVR